MKGFPFACPIELRYSDVDAMNHVNNAVYVAFLEVARLRLWREHFDFSGSARDIPLIVARVAVDYRSPIGLEDLVEVGVGVKAIGRTSFTLAYRVEASGRLAADAESVQLHYDYGDRRPVPITGAMRAKLEALLLPAAGP
ncbi:MAG TPA: thioesterase family protein [Thermoanaerobaculaceae bacterium]|nr:thioesterase family protein [Thermoanaerobaculaceae bacterium]